MKRLLTFLIVIALVIVAGFKAAVWWFANERMAEARTGLEAWGVLDRGTIGSGLDGRLFLSDSSWQDFRLTRPLEVGKLEFDAGSPLNLITALVDPDSMPARWTLQAERLGLMLEATMFRNWVTAEGQTGEGELALFVLSCAPDSRQQLGSGDLMRMGITGISGEALLKQTPDGLHGELSTAGTGSIDVDWPGARLDLTAPDRLLANSPGPMNVTIRDGGLMRKVAAYCARENGLQPPQWAGQAAQALQRGFQARGLVASDQLVALYRQWLMEGGELTVKLDPAQPFLGIPVHGEADSGKLTGWSVFYNGAEVPDVYLQEQPAPPVVEVPAGPGDEGEELQPGEPGWHRDLVENAGNWVGRQVRVTLNNDNVVEGRLVGVTDRELEVARVVAGGEVAYPMQVRAIVGFEVWRLGRGE
ncbi:acetylornithine deacetylase [Marinobacter salinexigens]|uniref:Acetylornithine deacetylase n=1 Tax=Marinobacter salinexigens TaxID=2919747 RepID=A0A5B0VLU0_9GAMM|nr:LSm family protein [Marinobacter salinexigens]KAA1175607.1 acetylornithine deacetylase [Marinobacter salinexigens]